MPRPRSRRRLRLPFVRRPRDASHDYDDASYDGGVSGGPYVRHILWGAALLIIVLALLRLAT
jgi:hypothetical protein